MTEADPGGLPDDKAYEWHRRKGVEAAWSEDTPYTIKMRVGHTTIAVDHEIAEALADAVLRLMTNTEAVFDQGAEGYAERVSQELAAYTSAVRKRTAEGEKKSE